MRSTRRLVAQSIRAVFSIGFWAAVCVVVAAGPASAIPRESHEEKEANLKQQATGGLFHKWTFDKDSIKSIPGGFVPLSSGAGVSAVWSIETDETAPSAPNVVMGTSVCENSTCFRLLIAQGLEYEYPDLAMRMRSADGVAGVGGLVFALRDAQNFYAVLVDLGAKRAQVIRVIEGVATVLGQAAVTLKPIDWHSLRVQRNTIVSKDFIEAFVDGVLVLSIEDQMLGTGQVGMAMQGKTSLFFDTLHAVPLFSHRPLSSPAAY
ncbi:MAG: hypothetical protein LZF86_190218 [Nitrospira sp.]|nr:MAG: hypothetical protein LZF86_190218 [Nitrospira sp.]